MKLQYNETTSRMRSHQEEEEEPLIPPRSSSKPQLLRSVRPQTPPSHPRVFEASNEMCQRLHTPPRALLNMDITQRNMHELQTRTSMSPPPGPPPPAPTSQELMHPPIAALVSQRREAMVRTNPQLRHQPPPGQLHHQQQHQQDRQAFGHYHRPTRMLQPTRSQQQPSSYRQYPPQMPRYHSEESLPSKAGTQGSGLYSSRIHSSADEISSVNRSPSELSSSDESFSRTDFSRDEEGESPRYC